MRKAGKWMDEQKVKIERMERECARLRAQAAELEGEGQQAETSSVPETTSASESLENSRGRKRKSIGEEEGSEAQKKRA
ncbi:hypothetical protein CEP53_000150 [Fusarium sp. AF-6]|nr:hypothetical protein CEP53_000150 [Fusarium sp. AF-6]